MNTSMNKGTMTKLLVFTFVALGTISCKEKDAPKQNSDSQNSAEVQTQGISFKNDNSASIFKGYLELKNALVASNQETASEVAKKMSELHGISGGDLEELLSNLAASDLAKQREYFSTLGIALEPILKAQLRSGAIYQQFCPMAFDNKGGYWLSDNDGIRNPYFGDMMLTCGKVTAEWKAL